MLNSKFESFSNVIDHKIDSLQLDYKTLHSKLETMHSTKDHASAYKQSQTHALRERGQLASPSHFSHDGNRRYDEPVNPLKEFTFSEKGHQRAMYSTDGFAMQNQHRTLKDDLRDESRVLIETIRKNLDESKKYLEYYKSEPRLENT
jgi:hypothetical protein